MTNIDNTTALDKSLYAIKINDIDGQPIDLAQHKGKKLIIVNVASECGFTPQYNELQAVYEQYSDKVTILGVPCNDFGGQEPGTTEEIKKFCTMTFGITFPMTEKVGITANTHPLYQWLCKKEMNGVDNYKVNWNFHKFLINADGTLANSLPSNVKPNDPQVIAWINK